MNPTALIPILVVEDSVEDFTALSRAFRKNAVPNPVLRCEDGDQALEYLKGYGKHPDWPSQLPVIILLDLNMPRHRRPRRARRAQARPRLAQHSGHRVHHLFQ